MHDYALESISGVEHPVVEKSITRCYIVKKRIHTWKQRNYNQVGTMVKTKWSRLQGPESLECV